MAKDGQDDSEKCACSRTIEAIINTNDECGKQGYKHCSSCNLESMMMIMEEVFVEDEKGSDGQDGNHNLFENVIVGH